MKKTIYIFLLTLTSFMLLGCENVPNKYEEIFNEIKAGLNYQDNQLLENNFNLITNSTLYEEAYITYNTSNANFLTIENNQAIINKTAREENVKLIIRITLEEVTETFELNYRVVKGLGNELVFKVLYINDGKNYQVDEYYRNEKLILPKEPTKENQIFIGWSFQEELIREDFIVKGHMRIYAVYNDLTNRTVNNTKLLNINLDNGLSYLEIDFEITNQDNKKLELIINDEKIDIFKTNDNLNKISLNFNLYHNINIVINHSENIIINNIMTADNKAIDNLNKDFEEIIIVTEHLQRSVLSLPKKGVRGSTYSWSLKPEDSKYFNLETGEILPPENELIEIFLLLEISLEGEISNKEISLTLGLPNIIELSELDNLINGKIARVEAIITAIYKIENEFCYLIKDKNVAKLIKSTKNNNLKVGNKVNFTIHKDNLEYYFEDYQVISQNNKVEENLLLSLKDLENKLYQKFYIEGIATSNIVNDRFTIYLDNVIEVRNISDKYYDVKKGEYVEMSGHIVIEKGQYSIYVTEINKLNTMKIKDDIIADIIMNSINFNELITYPIKDNIVLPKTDPIFNSQLEWTSELPEFLSNQGVYSSPDIVMETNLNLTIKLESKVIARKQIKVRIIPS